MRAAPLIQRLAVLGLCCLLCSVAQAQEPVLRVCVDAVAYPPYTTPQHDGWAQKLAERSALKLGLQLRFYSAPINRCRAMLQAGQIDALNGVAYVAQNRKLLQFPWAGEAEVPARAIAVVSFGVYRKRGTVAGWNGQAFEHLTTPVLVNSGLVAVTDRLQQMRVAYDDGARDTESNLRKLHIGRAEVAVLLDLAAQEQIHAQGLSAEVERMAQPYARQNMYFAFSSAYYAQHRQLAEQFWFALDAEMAQADFRREILDLP
ncbi:hypothetical protein ACFFKC_15275 [Pseudoduganella danionis]|uniref:Transporter substrate-binding domain-containing protein n=1 Tax=Pseudoduganella danionis TaxID=1890295 RepID=A0ABW9SPX2_9BURK|nr:hypothetical protein [Pseudoduganella danionis]MTW33253.1 hypothetical protein [Pseudoduganella danionis]